MRVRIYKPAKTAMQSRCSCNQSWCIDPVIETARRTQGLMRWTTADDALSCLCNRLRFATQSEALTFARTRGWEFSIETPHERRVVAKSFLDNFNPDRRRTGR